MHVCMEEPVYCMYMYVWRNLCNAGRYGGLLCYMYDIIMIG